MNNIYYCNDCETYTQIQVVPPPDLPDVKVRELKAEYCPLCGDDLGFGLVEED